MKTTLSNENLQGLLVNLLKKKHTFYHNNMFRLSINIARR